MKIKTLTSQSLSVGDIKFYDSFTPGLLEGNYNITVTQTLSGVTNSDQTFQQQQVFTLSGPRFSLDTQDIQAMQPAPNSQGIQDTCLPHIVLTQPMLPWERRLKDNQSVPWMALLVLEESELWVPSAVPAGQVTATQAFTATVQTLLQDDPRILKPSISASTPELAITCQSICISQQTFTQIMPHLDELPYLSHCRQVNVTDKAILGTSEQGWFSVVWSNRFPKAATDTNPAPVKNIVHLVSLEGFEDYLIANPVLSKDYVQLVSLASWSFICAPEQTENFAALAANLANGTSGDNVHLLRASLPPDDGSAEASIARNRLADGYVPLLYRLRTGEQTLAWYRGPFSPVPVETLTVLPSNSTSSAALMIYDATYGMFDTSYAAAWQMGRSLALASESFAQALMELRSQLHQATNLYLARETRFPPSAPTPPYSHFVSAHQRIADTLSKGKFVQTVEDITHGRTRVNPSPQILLPSVKEKAKPLTLKEKQIGIQRLLQDNPSLASPDLMQQVLNWLCDLYTLKNIPFSVFIADPQLLPLESIRFFHIDANWLNQLVEGALSIGLHSSQDETYNGFIESSLKNSSGYINFEAGLLLYSRLVTAWPGLAIRASAQGTPLAARLNRLSSNVLMCLFQQIPDEVTLSEPQEQLSFGVTGSSLTQGFVELRNLTSSGILGMPLANQPLFLETSINNFLRDSLTRVVNIEGLLNFFKTQLNLQSPLSSAQLAVEMVRTPEAVIFSIPGLTPSSLKIPLNNSTHERNIIMPQMDKLPLLTYKLITIPNPVQINHKTEIDIVVSNNTVPPEKVYLQELIINIGGAGSGAQSLTLDLSGVEVQINDSNWSVTSMSGPDSGIYSISPIDSTQAICIETQGLQIQIQVPQVNGEVGTCFIALTEKTSLDSTKTDSPRIVNQALPISKYIGYFCLDDFQVDKNNISQGESVRLSWTVQGDQGQDPFSLMLEWTDEQGVGQTVEVTSQTAYPENPDIPFPIYDSTNFTLAALVNFNGQITSIKKHACVTVPVPQIQNFAVQSSWLLKDSSTTLSWSAVDVDYCQLVANQKVIEDNLHLFMTNYTITPQCTTTYTLNACDKQGNIKATSSVPPVEVYMPQFSINKLLPVASKGIAVVNSTLYISDINNGVIHIFDTVSSLDQQVTTSSTMNTADQGNSTYLYQRGTLAASPDQSKIYICCNWAVDVLTTADNKISCFIDFLQNYHISQGPTDIGITTTGIITTLNGFGDSDKVAIFNSDDRSTIAIVDYTNNQHYPIGLALYPSNSANKTRLYVANFWSGNVFIYGLPPDESFQQVNTIPPTAADGKTTLIGKGPRFLAISSDDKRLFIATYDGISVIDTNDNVTLKGTILWGPEIMDPAGLISFYDNSNNTQKLALSYITDSQTGQGCISIFTLDTINDVYTVVNQIPLQINGVEKICVNSDGSNLYAASSNGVFLINLHDFIKGELIPAPPINIHNANSIPTVNSIRSTLFTTTPSVTTTTQTSAISQVTQTAFHSQSMPEKEEGKSQKMSLKDLDSPTITTQPARAQRKNSLVYGQRFTLLGPSTTSKTKAASFIPPVTTSSLDEFCTRITTLLSGNNPFVFQRKAKTFTFNFAEGSACSLSQQKQLLKEMKDSLKLLKGRFGMSEVISKENMLTFTTILEGDTDAIGQLLQEVGFKELGDTLSVSNSFTLSTNMLRR